MAKKSVKEILAEVMPEMEIVEGQRSKPADAADEASSPGPSLAELRRKYLGFDAEESAAHKAKAADAPAADDVVVAQVRPKAAASDSNTPSTPKTVVVSRKTGKVIARQG